MPAGPMLMIDTAAPSPAPTRPRFAYIPGLDGMRGFWVVLGPIIFHARPDFLPGGILAIDLFFVLSSYLITSIALNEWDKTGRIDLVAYAGRRARRLLPALLLCIGALTMYLAFFADPGLIARWTGSLVATLAYSANWFEIFSGVSYFQQFENPSPLYHAWSFAIEEQFYVFAPFFFLFCLKFFRAHAVRMLVALSALFALASAVIMSVLYTGGDPSRVYYGTDTRAQALFVGILLAGIVHRYGPPRTPRGRNLLVAGGYVSAIAFGVAVFTISEKTGWMFDYGGFLVVAFVAGAMVLALSQPAKGPLHWFFGWAPVRWLGKVSYGLYLFHWPIYLVVIKPDRIKTNGGFALGLLLTVAAAGASYHLIEKPIQQRRMPFLGRRVQPWPAAFGASVVVIAILAGLLAVNATKPAEVRQVLIAAAGSTQPGGAPGAGGALGAAGELRVLVVGDSVSVQVGEALIAWAQKHPGKIVVYNKAHLGCIVARYGDKRVPGGDEGPVGDLCSAWNEPVLPEKLSDPDVISWVTTVTTFRPDVVIGHITPWDVTDRRVPSLGPDWTHVGNADFDDYATREYRLATQVLTATGAHMIWLNGAHLNREITPQNDPARIDRLNEIAAAATTGLRVRFADYPGFVGPIGSTRETQIRRDGVHLSDRGRVEVAEWLAGEILAVG